MNKIIVYARMRFLKKDTWSLIDSNMGSRYGPPSGLIAFTVSGAHKKNATTGING
jgi:hypothetical protein